MKNILITGATGQFGSTAINILLTKNYPPSSINAMVRDKTKATDLQAKGINVHIGDYNDVESLTAAFKGIDIVLFVSASDVAQRTQQHENVMKAIRASDVKHVVYTSFVKKENSGPSAIAFVTDAHINTEHWLIESGKKYTFLRNNLYMDFVPVFIGEKALGTGVYFPAANGKTAAATREDMAEAAANVL
jgi:NAD(P)H dehydrogenase (quinone)